MKIKNILIIGIWLISLTLNCKYASAQDDKNMRTVNGGTNLRPEMTIPDMQGIVIQSPITGQTQVLLPNEIGSKTKVFYKDLKWPPKKKDFDPYKPALYFDKKEPGIKDLLIDKPWYALYMAAGTVAGMLNNQVQGINKEIEIITNINTYSRTTVPPSAKDPFLVPVNNR